ncbi:MAG: kelch repeat-containing protein, partial [Candidatus Methylomirabilales bacterium]
MASPEPTAWQVLNDGDPPPRESYIVYDGARARPVLMVDEVWELLGEDWARRFLGALPLVGAGECFAYDAGRGVTVALVSDYDSTLAETWEYGGGPWVQRFPASSPSRRIWCQMVYDSDRQRIVLFGGHTLGTASGLNDTWEYNGTNWTHATPQSSPPVRGQHGMAYDSGRQRIVVFGGSHGGTTYGDTWEYDGNRWKQKSPSASPTQRWGPGMAYDPVRQKTVLFGGARNQDFGDTWEWNGTNWTQKFPAQSPAPRNLFGMAYDEARSKVILEGGRRNDGDFNDTWAFDGTNWQQIAVSGVPVVRESSAVAYDPALGMTVLYGGNNRNQFALWDTWHFSGSSWELQPGAGSATASYRFQLAFDPGISGLVGFSGSSGGTMSPDRHEYSGTPPRTWTDVGTSGPDRRTQHGWAMAQPFGGVLMFGGRARDSLGTEYLADDTWTLEGQVWRLHT